MICLNLLFITIRATSRINADALDIGPYVMKKQRIKMVQAQTLDEVIGIFEKSSDLEEAKKALRGMLEKINKEP